MGATLALLIAGLLAVPRDAQASNNDAHDVRDVQSSMQCDRASEPGRVRCTVETHVTGGRTLAWADVEILSLPEFASALKGRIGPQDALSHDAFTTKWALGLVARRAGQGEVRARVRVVACDAPRPGATANEPRSHCAPVVTEVRAPDQRGGRAFRIRSRLRIRNPQVFWGRSRCSGYSIGMHLPGRLKATTLGDLLGTLSRSGATGTLELAESNGRVHRVHLASGGVIAVELDRATASLAEILRRQDDIDEDTLRRSLLRAMASRRLHGEVLVRDFHLSPDVVGRALRRQVMLRLSVLDDLSDAQVCFRVTVRPPRGALVDAPLDAPEFLAGKKRTRDRDAAPTGASRATATFPGGWDPARAQAYRALGVSFNADASDVKQAYRRLVRAYHPDLHPDATHDERRVLSSRFAEVTAAYRSLVA